MPSVDILIVGAGPAGLSTAGALKRLGLAATLLEQAEAIGGSWLRRYQRLHLHTVRAFSGLAHYPIPRRFPAYLSKNQYAQYLQDYARYFKLDVVLNSAARQVRAAEAGDPYRLVVETEGEPWRCRVVVIAAGQFGQPLMPSWPGAAGYQGQLIHSARYQTGRVYAGQRVLVIGIGNSGAEIAADLAEQGAAQVAVSIRTAPTIVPRDILGIPVQVLGLLLSRLPPPLADQLTALLVRVVLGDLTRHGLPRPAWLPFSAKRIPVIDVGFVSALKRGRVQVRPSVARFTAGGVVFEGGLAEDFDVVIAATGFSSGLGQLVAIPNVLDARGYPLNPQGQPTAQPGLYFIGYVESHRGLLYEAKLASQRLAGNIAKNSNW